MSRECRLLQDGITDAHHHFAVEEALVRLVDKGVSPPTLRLRRVQRAVFVGVYQDTWAEVDVDYCREHDIKIVRRANAGGAVYHDLGSFCYSAFFPRAAFPQSEEELYRLFAEPVICTCADYGVTARFHGMNDVLVGERKIYGSAQITWYDAFVQSGTFLVNMDLDVMDRALTPPALKFADKPARSVKERVTSLAREVGRELDTHEVMARFAANFTQVLGIQLVPGGLMPEERELAAELLAAKYGTDEWNLGTRHAYQVTVSAKAKGGVVFLSADMEEGTMRQARIRGDFLASDQAVLGRLEQALAGRRPEEAQAVVQAAGLPRDVSETLVRLLSEASQEGTFSAAETDTDE
jgi:lipoate-protein ligase A